MVPQIRDVPAPQPTTASRDRCGVLRRSGNAYAQGVEQTDLGVAQCRRTNVINFSGAIRFASSWAIVI
jgi:hypothetical protein